MAYILVHSQNDCIMWGQARRKPGARKSVEISYVGAGIQVLGPSSTAFPRAFVGGRSEVEQVGPELAPV